eukprot:2083894-Rhodomonas_salina.3
MAVRTQQPSLPDCRTTQCTLTRARGEQPFTFTERCASDADSGGDCKERDGAAGDLAPEHDGPEPSDDVGAEVDDVGAAVADLCHGDSSEDVSGVPEEAGEEAWEDEEVGDQHVADDAVALASERRQGGGEEAGEHERREDGHANAEAERKARADGLL